MYTINTPRVEECIESVMARHGGTSERSLVKYFEEVHQYLAPLARDLERENAMLRELAMHLRHCPDCGEMDVSHCNDGSVLWDAVMGPNVL